MRETILVVEDGDAVRNLVCAMLVQNGYRVLEARDAHHALRVCEKHPEPIQLVLTDLVMPGMKGAELAECLCRARPGLRVLLMSGYAEARTLADWGCGQMAFLAKPFTSVQLVEKVREILGGARNGLTNQRRADD